MRLGWFRRYWPWHRQGFTLSRYPLTEFSFVNLPANREASLATLTIGADPTPHEADGLLLAPGRRLACRRTTWLTWRLAGRAVEPVVEVLLPLSLTDWCSLPRASDPALDVPDDTPVFRTGDPYVVRTPSRWAVGRILAAESGPVNRSPCPWGESRLAPGTVCSGDRVYLEQMSIFAATGLPDPAVEERWLLSGELYSLCDWLEERSPLDADRARLLRQAFPAHCRLPEPQPHRRDPGWTLK